MDASDGVDEVTGVVDRFMNVPNSAKTVVRLPLIAPDATPWLDVALDYGEQCVGVASVHHFNEELVGAQFDGTENPLLSHGSGVGVSELCPGHHTFVDGDDSAWPTKLQWVGQQVPAAQVTHERVPVGDGLVIDTELYTRIPQYGTLVYVN